MPNPSPETLEKYAEAMKPRPEDKGELGYRLVNPDDPPEEWIRVPFDPSLQRFAEDFLWRNRQNAETGE